MTQPFGRRRGFVYVASPRPPEDDWIAIVAESFVALVEAGPGERGVDVLSELAGRDDITLEQVVSSIPLGDDGVDSFAVVHVDADGAEGWQATVVVRGRAVVDAYSVGGARRFSSSGVQPWLIATFRDVVAVELGGPARRFDAVSRRTPTALQIGLGTAHAGSVLWSAGASERIGGDSSDVEAGFARPAAALEEDTVRRLPGAVLDEVRVRRTPPTPPAPAEDGPEPMRPPGFDEETVLRRRFLSAPADARVPFDPEPVPMHEPAAPADPVQTPDVDEPTVERRPLLPPPTLPAIREPASSGSVPSAPSTPGAPGVTSDSGDSGSPVVLRTPGDSGGGHDAAGSEGEDASDGREAPAQVLVGIRGQDPVPLEAPTVFGRRPSEGRRSGVASVLIAVASPNREVSASHVRIERAGRVVVVTDLRSRNGTLVTVEGGRPKRLRPGESVAVPGPAAVEVGDGTIIDITPVWWTP